MREVEAWEMAQPTPVKDASAMVPSLTESSSVISSPQLGFRPLRTTVGCAKWWRWAGFRLSSAMSSV